MSADLHTETPPDGPSPRRPGLRALLHPGWIAVIALALVFTWACWFILAPWQFGRHEERNALNAQIDFAITAAPASVTEFLPLQAQPAITDTWRAVSASGTFVPDQQVFIRLRQWQGTPAQEIVVPFLLSDGTRILIDRGFVTEISLSAGELPAALPSGEVTIIGRVTQDQPDPLNRPPQTSSAGRKEAYGIDSAALLGSAPGARSGFIQLVDGTPGVLIPVGLPDEDDGPYLSYALQWCVFGAVALLAVGFFAYREVTVDGHDDGDDAGHHEGHDAGHHAETAPRPAATGKFHKSDLYD